MRSLHFYMCQGLLGAGRKDEMYMTLCRYRPISELPGGKCDHLRCTDGLVNEGNTSDF